MNWKPIILECPNPENCDELHNETIEDLNHHYGCECYECMRFYWFLKH